VGNTSAYAVPHDCYECAGDDRWCVIAVEDDEQWRALCSVIGRSELAEDERFLGVARLRNRDDVDALLSDWTRRHEAPEVMNLLQAAGVPAGVVQSGLDLVADTHLEARGFIETVQHPVLGAIRLAGSPLKFSSGAHEPLSSSPPLGADNAYVITEVLGYERAQLERWEEEEVVY
jgi:crotonobetainyl-CoA:carnitine CoA-transferase CaiB-like acyl-CoA transferase